MQRLSPLERGPIPGEPHRQLHPCAHVLETSVADPAHLEGGSLGYWLMKHIYFPTPCTLGAAGCFRKGQQEAGDKDTGGFLEGYGLAAKKESHLPALWLLCFVILPSLNEEVKLREAAPNLTIQEMKDDQTVRSKEPGARTAAWEGSFNPHRVCAGFFPPREDRPPLVLRVGRRRSGPRDPHPLRGMSSRDLLPLKMRVTSFEPTK